MLFQSVYKNNLILALHVTRNSKTLLTLLLASLLLQQLDVSCRGPNSSSTYIARVGQDAARTQMCAMQQQWAVWSENKVLTSMVFHTQGLAGFVHTAMEYRKGESVDWFSKGSRFKPQLRSFSSKNVAAPQLLSWCIIGTTSQFVQGQYVNTPHKTKQHVTKVPYVYYHRRVLMTN